MKEKIHFLKILTCLLIYHIFVGNQGVNGSEKLDSSGTVKIMKCQSTSESRVYYKILKTCIG